MSRTPPGPRDHESGHSADDHRYPPPQPILNVPAYQAPHLRGINYSDSSWLLYAMYSKIVQEEDNKIAENHQKSADGILIFTGLFSATVAALLAVSIPDLKKPDPQETSAFYIEKIYRLMNASDPSIPSTLPALPASSPPRYVIWVNSLWLLSLLISLAGALSATIEQRCVLRHMSITQNQKYSPEMRARIHAVFAKSEFGRFNFRDTSTIMFCLHLSLFLFMAGVLIYFFNICRATFYAVVWWVAIVTIPYILFTMVPIFISEELLYTPFSTLALRVYLLFTSVVACISDHGKKHYDDLQGRYSTGFIEGKTKSAEKDASERSSSIDNEVLEKTLLSLDEDQALGAFFDAIPGFCVSNLVQMPLSGGVRANLQQSITGFLDRTFSSLLVTEEDRTNRLITCLDAAHSALGPDAVSQILRDFSKRHTDEALQSVGIRHCLRRPDSGTGGDDLIHPNIRRIAACIIACTQDRGDKWTRLVTEALGVPEKVFQKYRADRDSVLLAISIHVTHETLRTGRSEPGVLESLSQFDVGNTLAELQHEFCTLWNDIVQRARHEGNSSTPTLILSGIRHLFITLHQGTSAALTRFPAFSRSIYDLHPILSWPLSYPSCNVSGHRRDSSPQASTASLSTQPHIQPGISPQAPARPDTSAISYKDTPEPIRGSTSSGGPAL